MKLKFLKSVVAVGAALMTAVTPLSATAASALDLNLPSLGSTADAGLSPQDEYRLGVQLMQRVRSDASYLADPELMEYLGHLGYQLVSHARTSTYNFFFFPIRDDSLNAFALPGGFIAVHTGTIISAQSESELAGVMAHEVSHVAQRHIARMIEGQSGNLAITLGSILLAILAARAGGSSGGNAAAGIVLGSQAAMIQSQLNYSQNAEREADRMGISTLYNAGFDPRGMEDFFARLQSNNRYYRSAAPAYLSTHPLTEERMADMENRSRQLHTRMHVDSDDFPLVQMRARVLQLDDWDGWTKLKKQFQRELAAASGKKACAINYGISVVEQELKNPKQAYAAARNAMRCGMKSAILERNLTRTRFDAADSMKEKLAALEDARKAVTRYPLSAMMAMNYVDLLYALGRHEDLIAFLRSGQALSENSSDYHAILARSYEALGRRSLQYMHTGEMYALQGGTEAAVYQYGLAQKANDGDYYVMSEIDARLRELRRDFDDEKKRR
ncbi:M48 family metallopeptidase [Sutterella sp.]|uniref:M48 family metallopeptidase n=1 Tax=Sutterella sp. TaxID=1981025 RepID=UPI0026DF55F7|nr:M48 family metalloprotease [Sutterella sp.]MDO5531004.1 M48 family metalloprotease [Sutterella sp.]